MCPPPPTHIYLLLPTLLLVLRITQHPLISSSKTRGQKRFPSSFCNSLSCRKNTLLPFFSVLAFSQHMYTPSFGWALNSAIPIFAGHQTHSTLVPGVSFQMFHLQFNRTVRTIDQHPLRQPLHGQLVKREKVRQTQSLL